MEQVDILFFSGLFPKNEETEIKEKMKSGMADAQSALQWNIIDGLEANKCGILTVLNRLPVNSYPRGYMDPFVKEFPFQHKCGELSDTNVGYCNITVIKQITMGTPFRSKIRKWVKDGETLKKVFLLYGAFGLSLELAKAVKRWNDQVETVCIIADLPEYSSIVKQSGLRKLFENYEVRKSRKLCCYIDKFVLLTDQMAQRLQLAAPYVVMEGIAPRSETYTDSISIPELKDRSYILYTGTLHYEFGIGTLLDAFGRIQNPDIRLVICGFGEA
jgi:glycosyltransferase involved in cell wall biosynthesis